MPEYFGVEGTRKACRKGRIRMKETFVGK
jgi:hypothetical protein